MLELIYIIFALPVVCAALAISGVLGSGSLLHWLNRLTAAAVGVAVILLAQSFTPTQPFNSEYVYLDALNVWVILDHYSFICSGSMGFQVISAARAQPWLS